MEIPPEFCVCACMFVCACVVTSYVPYPHHRHCPPCPSCSTYRTCIACGCIFIISITSAGIDFFDNYCNLFLLFITYYWSADLDQGVWGSIWACVKALNPHCLCIPNSNGYHVEWKFVLWMDSAAENVLHSHQGCEVQWTYENIWIVTSHNNRCTILLRFISFYPLVFLSNISLSSFLTLLPYL